MQRLELVRRCVASDPRLQGIHAEQQNDEIHLSRADDLFARLIPLSDQRHWRMESFRNQERWEIIEFQGTLEECLDYLGEHPHYLFFQ